MTHKLLQTSLSLTMLPTIQEDITYHRFSMSFSFDRDNIAVLEVNKPKPDNFMAFVAIIAIAALIAIGMLYLIEPYFALIGFVAIGIMVWMWGMYELLRLSSCVRESIIIRFSSDSGSVAAYA